MEALIEMFMYSILGSIFRHIGVGLRYFFMRVILRKKVTYKSLRYDNPKDTVLANFDNAFVNTFFGFVVFMGIFIFLLVKYLS